MHPTIQPATEATTTSYDYVVALAIMVLFLLSYLIPWVYDLVVWLRKRGK